MKPKKASVEPREQYRFFDHAKDLEKAEQTLKLAKELKNDDRIILAYNNNEKA